ncbi:MAG: very short patch repair endonuclease [Acidimicrobiales bacterium]
MVKTRASYDTAGLQGSGQAPTPSSPDVSRRMSRVRTWDTDPEVRLRRILHSRGLRYRIHRRPLATLRCRPDIVFGPARVAVFVDGCFWHGCPTHASWPKANAEWWRQKIQKTRDRDEATTRDLVASGWYVMRVWEHEDPVVAADTVERVLAERRRGNPVRSGAGRPVDWSVGRA